MDSIELKKLKALKGQIIPPPDKSISHRAVMFASLAKGRSIIRNFLMAEDPISTMNAMRMLAVQIDKDSSKAVGHQGHNTTTLIIHGKGLHALKEPFDVINCGNSGTTVRLISGILAGNPFFSVLTGDDSLKERPMARVINPLKEMGADIYARMSDKYLPMAIKGKALKAIQYNMPIASAQVKSCLILAGLYAEGTTIITEPQRSRDHTEKMLKAMGAPIKEEIDSQSFHRIVVEGIQPSGFSLQPIDITIPSDFSSAAFFIVGALIVPNSELLIRNVCINPTRTGLLSVIKNMGADVRVENIRDVSGEMVADIYCRSVDNLKAVNVSGDIMPSLIDEFPILCVLATQAEGITEIRGAQELRVKESDRIKAMATELKKMGVELQEYPDGIAIKGRSRLIGCEVESYSDHRVAMSLAIAGALAEGTTIINNASVVDISFPGFFEEIKKLSSE